MNDFIDVVDTAKLPSKDLKYTLAGSFKSCCILNTAQESSIVPTVSSSEMHGKISVRTIPSSVQKTENESTITSL